MSEKKPSKWLGALVIFGRILYGLLSVLMALNLVHSIERGVVFGKASRFPAMRGTEPGLFWAIVVAWIVVIALLAYGAIRGFDRRPHE